MCHKNLYLSICALAAFAVGAEKTLAQDNMDRSNTSSAMMTKSLEQEVEIEPTLSTNALGSQFSGIGLAPRAGHFEALLGAGQGSLIFHNDGATTQMNMTNQSVQLAAGVGAGFYIGGLLNLMAYSGDSNSFSSKTTGAMEPQAALGYSLALSDSEKMLFQVSYAFDTGPSKSSSDDRNSGGTSTNDSKSGGSAIIPNLQFETKSLLGMTSGIRASYYIAGDTQSRSTNTYTRGDGTLSSSSDARTRKGGNITSAILFAQKSLGDVVAIGGSIGGIFIAKSNTTSSSGQLNSYESSATNFATASVNLPIKLARNFALIPEVNYYRSDAGGKLELINTGLNGRLSF